MQHTSLISHLLGITSAKLLNSSINNVDSGLCWKSSKSES